ncbi:hypothetical protein BJY04DRAFT_196743 [Aspergillus karnatakaensis]|uniref:uncharacterized protein n=1 Tax=Aspergillus karnatakaensis TaxID=1810916 RepID=UPI003CCCCE6D
MEVMCCASCCRVGPGFDSASVTVGLQMANFVIAAEPLRQWIHSNPSIWAKSSHAISGSALTVAMVCSSERLPASLSFKRAVRLLASPSSLGRISSQRTRMSESDSKFPGA